MTSHDLQVARAQLQMTQRQLGDRLGLSAQQISNYESGRAKIPQQTALALQALHMPQGSLVHLAAPEVQLLRSFVQALRKALKHQLVFIVLFGSKVRGEATPDSDIDICLIVRKKTPMLRDLVFKILFAIDPQYEYRVAPVIYSLDEFQMNEAMESPFIDNLKADGVLL